MLANPKNETVAESENTIGVPTPGSVRNLRGAMGMKPSHHDICLSSTPGRLVCVLMPSNCSKISGSGGPFGR